MKRNGAKPYYGLSAETKDWFRDRWDAIDIKPSYLYWAGGFVWHYKCHECGFECHYRGRIIERHHEGCKFARGAAPEPLFEEREET